MQSRVDNDRDILFPILQFHDKTMIWALSLQDLHTGSECPIIYVNGTIVVVTLSKANTVT